MENLISLFIIIPLFGFLINVIIPKKDELRLSQVSFVMLGIQFIGVLVYTIFWVLNDEPALYKKQLVLLNLENFQLYIDFVFDEITAVFLSVGAFIAFLIITYSRNYLHREDGFKRFFTTILFFYLGYNLIVLSGNLTTIFVGWEIAGISSFLLIAYYRNRFIPVNNAIKIFSVYRLGDIALILAMWLGHHIWHSNISINTYFDKGLVLEHIHHYPWLSLSFGLCVLLASIIKSAQFPFSAWLSRAMEGPTPSSAIFYSSLAVHLGVLVLLRTYSFWVLVPWMREIIIVSGGLSFVLATITSRIQPSIKGQIAYATVAQLGVMFIEVALGWHSLALIHFASHAMFRSYQLLISPSIVSYAVKKQFFEFEPIKRINLHPLLRNISNSVYILSLNEWYLDKFMYYIVWGPFKKIGGYIHLISHKTFKWISILLMIVFGVFALLVRFVDVQFDVNLLSSIIIVFAFIQILRAFTEKEKVLYAWFEIAAFHILILTGFLINGVPFFHLSFYFGGILISYFVGHFSINMIRKNEVFVSLAGYQGHCYEYPLTEFLFLISCLGLIGFPITSAFVGMELLLNGVSGSQYMLLVFTLLCFLVNGLTMIRIYARIFLGPHVKTYHTSARKSS